jgi:transcriptional regulator with XRE-family HTH domain
MFDNLGKALSLLREIRGKSQAEVARGAGIAKSQLSKYEKGKELPKLGSLKKVLDALEVGPFEIFYTMHLIDMQAENLDLSAEFRREGLPPLVLPTPGVLSGSTDEAFQRLFKEVQALYHEVAAEKVKFFPRRH